MGGLENESFFIPYERWELDSMFDEVNYAPLLVGGKDVSTLIDGEAISHAEELNKLKALELIECNQLDGSYIQLKYRVKR